MKIFSWKSISPTAFINKGWETFTKLPYGNHFFSKIVGKFIPYTGSISPLVQKIEAGHAEVKLKDKKAVRNHLNSIHAIALANLGEFTTGLSIISQLNDTAKAILVKIEIEYFKKAKGDVIADAVSQIPKNMLQDTELTVAANIKNSQHELVCRVTAVWRIRP